jgi:phosphoenolpyruvate synthase/pyruvate phosphate dikinase
VANWQTVLDAIREVWSSVWYYRAFDEREYRSIRHQDVAMAILVHHNFPEEEANGVAITNNPFDTEGLNPAFYINVQVGDFSVVQPGAGITTDQLIYYHDAPGTPIVYVSSSSLVAEGEHVLTARQVNTLGKALSAVHDAFSPAYGPASGLNDAGWYAMDTEFKFDDRGSGGELQLYMKQARPYPGRAE